MALTDFSIQEPSTVILDDDRDPDVSWANHERRYPGQTNRGGVDVVARVGTPVRAWADGTVEHVYNDGSAGNVARLRLANDPGWILDYKHLSGFVPLLNGWASKGTIIGYSGNSGGVTQHLHLNLVDPSGVRRNPWHYVSDRAQNQEDDMSAEGERTILAKLTNIENILAVDPIELTTSTGQKMRVAGVRGVVQAALATATNVEAIIAVDPAERGGLRATLSEIESKLDGS